jgi:chloride channel protein, CIC family
MGKFRPWRYPSEWAFFRIDDRLLLIVIGAAVGSCSGFAALLLNRSLVAILEMLHDWRHYWWAFLLPATGAALSSIFLDKIVKEGAGHGVPEVILSVFRHGGLLRLRSSFSRLLSSWLTIGSGGSAGPEAPVVMSGAAIGSNIARFFALNDRQRITLVGCGAAGAISSIFNAPIAGMVFSIEVIIGEWSAVNIIPIAIASVAGTEISRFLQGNQIAFSHRQFNLGTIDIVASIGLAAIAAALSIVLTRLLRRMHTISGKTRMPLWLRAAVGGCAVGIIGIFSPDVLGEGYHSIRMIIEGIYPGGIAVASFLMLAKILATSLTLGWGGSGGVFAPCLVIGSFAGIAWHRVLVFLWPTVTWVNEGCFALIGMAGMISGILQAPLTAIFLIVEITGGYEEILPLIIVSTISTTLCHYFEPASFYLRDLVEKRQLLRPGTDGRVLADLSVGDLLEKDCIVVGQQMLLRNFIEIVKKSHRNHFPVEDEQTGKFLGMIQMDQIRPYLFDTVMYDTVFLEQIMEVDVVKALPDDDLNDVLRKMDELNLFSIPVVDSGKFVGMISKATVLDQYRKELLVQTTQ